MLVAREDSGSAGSAGWAAARLVWLRSAGEGREGGRGGLQLDVGAGEEALVDEDGGGEGGEEGGGVGFEAPFGGAVGEEGAAV